MDFDIASDLAGEVGFGGKDAAGDQIALNFGEPDFDLIEPGRVGRCVVELKVGMGGEELRHGLGLVRRKIVGDDVDLLALGLRGDHICEKRRRTPRWCGAGWFCPGPVRWKPRGRRRARECRGGNTQSRGARHARAKGQNWIQPIKSLNGALFIHAEHGRVGRRLEIEPNNVGRLGLEGRIVADHVMTPPERLQTGLGPHPSDPHVTDAQLGGELAGTPMRGTVGGPVMQAPINDPGFQPLGARSHRLAQMASPRVRRCVPSQSGLARV